MRPVAQAVLQDRSSLTLPASGPKRGRGGWDYYLAREAKRDQEQAVEIPQFHGWETGDTRATVADGWVIPDISGSGGKRFRDMSS